MSGNGQGTRAAVDMDDRCRCPHPEHESVCPRVAVGACDTCHVALCSQCWDEHHTSQHRVFNSVPSHEEASAVEAQS